MALHEFIAEYPYFVNSAIVLLACLAGMAIFPRQRPMALRGALLALPWGIWSVTLVPEYWTPRLLFRAGRVGVEDFIWAFATGGMAWLMAAVLNGRQFEPTANLRQFAGRYAIVATLGAILFVPPWIGGAGVMNAFLISNIGLAIYLIFRRPDLWRLAVCGAIGFGLFNALVMKINLAMCPAYYAQMTPGALSGVAIWDLPLEELHWAVATGVVWPLVVCYVFNTRQRAAVQT